jgi:hypothetical protein
MMAARVLLPGLLFVRGLAAVGHREAEFGDMDGVLIVDEVTAIAGAAADLVGDVVEQDAADSDDAREDDNSEESVGGIEPGFRGEKESEHKSETSVSEGKDAGCVPYL